MILVAAPLAGRLTDRIGARWIMVTGASLMTVGILFIITRIELDATWQSLLLPLVVTGIGMGLTFAPMTAAAMRDVPPRIAGSASGILNTMRNIGQVLGIAVLGSLLQNRVGVHVDEEVAGLPLDSAARDQVVGLAEQSQFDLLAQFVPVELLGDVFAAVQTGFAEALRNTFVVGAFACLLAAIAATLIRNPIRATAPVRGQAAEDIERPGMAPAD